jgi:hypothetical protein
MVPFHYDIRESLRQLGLGHHRQIPMPSSPKHQHGIVFGFEPALPAAYPVRGDHIQPLAHQFVPSIRLQPLGLGGETDREGRV